MLQSIDRDCPLIMADLKREGLEQGLCTIQAPAASSGAPSGNYTNVAGLIGIMCMDSPLSAGNIQATEAKALAEIESLSLRHVLLDGYYSLLDGQNWGDIGWRALITNVATGQVVTYDLLGAERDSQSSQTRLKLRLVTL